MHPVLFLRDHAWIAKSRRNESLSLALLRVGPNHVGLFGGIHIMTPEVGQVGASEFGQQIYLPRAHAQFGKH